MTDEIASITVPAGACDTHIHVYDPRTPLAPNALGPAPVASVEDYRAVQSRLGLGRAVIVQPTAYGFDNTCTLDGIAALGVERTRGVAVVDETISDAELARLTEGGIRGVRFQMLPGGAIPTWEPLDRIAARVQEAGWHVQVQLDGRTLPEREAQIRRWPGRIVIDHVGKFLEPVPLDHPGFRTLASLLETGRVWVKLSAPYEVSKTGAPRYEDVGCIARELVRVAPERMLWASNWPHPGAKTRPDEAALLDLLLDWAPDDAARRRILVDNPAEVYGF